MADLQLTEQRKKEIKAQFARRRRNQLLLFIPVAIAIAPFAINSGGSFLGLDPLIWPFVTIGIVLAAFVFSRYNWRCPACNKYLGNSINPEFCSKCGAQLRG